MLRGRRLGREVAGKRGPHQFEPFRITVTVNLVGTFNVLRLAAAAMRDNAPDAAASAACA